MAYRKWTYFEQALHLLRCWVLFKLGKDLLTPQEEHPQSATDDE